MRIDRWNQKLVVEPFLAYLRTHPEEVKESDGHPYSPIGHVYVPRMNARVAFDGSVMYGWYARRHQYNFRPSFIARWRIRRAIKQLRKFKQMLLADQPPLWLELVEGVEIID